MPFAPPPPPKPAETIVWIQQPTAQDIAEAEAFYAAGGTLRASASMTCYVRADGALEACKSTPGAGDDPSYADAALRLADKYRLDRKASTPSYQVMVKVAFPKLYDVAPSEAAKPSQAEMDAANPAGLDGELRLLCRIDEAGATHDCRVDPAPSHDPRLDAVGLAVAGRFRSKPARLNGRPVASSQAFALTTKAHAIVNPAWERKPDGADLMAAFPVRAMREGVSGVGRVQCDVAADGTLIGCRIVSENPDGYGFGTAALLLTPNFRMKPRLMDGKPVGGASVVIPIRFETPGAGRGIGDLGVTIKVMSWAPWTATPTAQDVQAAFPKRATEKKVFGSAALRCGVSREGRLKECDVTSETPDGYGFGGAAKTLSRSFALDVAGVRTIQLQEVRVLVTVNFSERALKPASERFVRSIDWVRSFGPEDVTSAYPQQAAKAGVLSGRATVACRIGPDGSLDACKPQSEAPDGLGFGAAALKIAAVMKANLWSQDGEPIVGETVMLPIRLLYNGDPPPSPAPAPGG